MSNKINELKANMAGEVSQTVGEKVIPIDQRVGHYLGTKMKEIGSVLPKHMNKERLARISFNVIRTNPKLLECDINSLMGAVMECAKLGLEPNLMGQAYLIPFKKEVQFVIGYRGLIDLVRRSGKITNLEARVVYENDQFDYEYGVSADLKHKPALTNKGKAIAYYAVATFKDGGFAFDVMSIEDIENHRDKYSKAKNFGPWKDDFDAMAKKTVLRQLIKYLPISIEYLQHDEKDGSEVEEEILNGPEIIDMQAPVGIE
jgi:recombination protein RecT